MQELELPYPQLSPEAIPGTAASALFPGTNSPSVLPKNFYKSTKYSFPGVSN